MRIEDYSPNDEFGMAAAITAALRTGLLAQLTRAPASDGELAQRLALDLRATTLLLDVLQTIGLVRREGNLVEPGPVLVAAGSLPGGYPFSLGMWSHAEDFVRSGEPFTIMDRGPDEREQAYRNIVGGLATLFQGPARELAAGLPVHPKKILDVGCGSGVWSLALAERYGDAQVTGLDLPAVLENFRARAAALSLADRTHTIPSNMHEAEIPQGAFDLVIIANVLRLEPPERAASIVQRIAKGVAPGGALLVVDALAEGTPERDRARSLYALNLGLRTRTGQVHRVETISGWLAQAGLPAVTTIDIANGAGGLGGLLATRIK
jgi:SAM-dependent methyltransferase